MLKKLKIKRSHEERIVRGHPWIFSNEIEDFAAFKNLEKGLLVKVEIKKDQPFAIAYFNPNSLIAARILTYDLAQKIDEDFFIEKILAAKTLREKFFDKPFYRLIHSEADFLPGLVVERFNDVLCCQISTAGMEKLSPYLTAALEKIFPDHSIIFKNNSELRRLEGLEVSEVCISQVKDEIEIEENDLKFLINAKTGQKTGWFFDQRLNRKFIGSIAKDCDVLDAFCYLGGFGLNALKAGAKSVTFVDSASEAIQLLQKNYENLRQEFSAQSKVQFITEKVFDFLENARMQELSFDIVVLDPPAFIKNKKDFFSGIRGYEKLVKLAAELVKKNGILMLSSCSHHAGVNDIICAANDGFRKSGRAAKLIRTYGAGFDHPIHPALKESEYLKSLTFFIE